MKNEFNIFPIGYVRSKGENTLLEIEKSYIPALKSLDGFSNIIVLLWGHMVDELEYRKILNCGKPYKHSQDAHGIFSTRSPIRPNPILISTVSVLKIDYENGLICIPYIDAENDTPIIDIKPYHPSSDRVKNVTVPKWCSHWPMWYEDSESFNWSDEIIIPESINGL